MIKRWKEKQIRKIRYYKNKRLREQIKRIALKVVKTKNANNDLQILNENEDSVTVQPQFAVKGNLVGPLPSQILLFMGELADALNDGLPIKKRIKVAFESIDKSISSTYGVSVTIE